MHSSKEELDRYYDNTPRRTSIPARAYPVPPHGMLYSKSSSVYTIDGLPVENQPGPDYDSSTAVHKSVKITLAVILITVLLTGLIFAILSVTRLARTF